jgi:hypothetical protein
VRRRLPALLLLLLGCAGGERPPEKPPLIFVRQRGAWAPEDLNRDVAECVDASHAAVMGDARQLGAPPGAARAAWRERVVACMAERGWATGSSVEPEEWAQ